MKNTLKKSGAIRRLLVFTKPYIGWLIFALVFSLIQIAATLLAPIIIGEAIDFIIAKDNVNFDAVFVRVIMLIITVCAAVLFQWLVSLCTNKVAFKTVRDIRCAAFEKLNRVPLKTIDSRSHGDLMSRVCTDTDQVSDGLIQGFTQLFTGCVTIIGTLIFMLSINWLVTLVVVIITPLSLFAAYFIAKNSHNKFKEQSQKRGEMSGLAEEMLSAQKTVKAFSYEKKAEERFGVINEKLRVVGIKAMFTSSLVNPGTRFINGVVYAAVAIIGSLLVIQGNGFGVGSLFSFLAYANQYTKPFNEITGVITELQTATAAASRVFDLLDEDEESSDKGLKKFKAEGNVDIERVSFSYTDEPLITDFNLSVKKGQRVAIVGPTGCGKTTIINLLMRFYDVKSGVIKVDGVNIADMTRSSLRTNFGMVLQDTWLFNGTIRENIAYGKEDASEEEIVEAAKKAHIHSFISRLENGYDTVITDEGDGISQGQRQLLCIARILLTKPPMLILDEATSNIDTRTELKIQKAFNNIMQGRTSFIVAHRLSTIKEADIIIVMQSGNIVEKGSHAELLAKGGFYKQLVEAGESNLETPQESSADSPTKSAF